MIDPVEWNEEVPVPARVHLALAALFEALQYAEQTSSNRWDFAVEIDELAAMGLMHNDFRWMVRTGFVEHQREVTVDGDDGRAFRPTGDLTFLNGSCFVLADEGISLASEIFQAVTNGHERPSCSASLDSGETPASLENRSLWSEVNGRIFVSLPNWDAERRSLCIGSTTVKHFKWPALNQETILAAFHEEGWPARIDDPLPPQPEQDSKRRLSDTIKCLNRKQKNQLIRFHGDGTGEGIVWELIEEDERGLDASI